MTNWVMDERGAATTNGRAQAPCSMIAMSPLAKVISFPGVAAATPEMGSLRSFSYKMDVRVFLRRRAKISDLSMTD